MFLRLVEAVKGQTGYVLAEFPDGIRQAALDLGHVMDVGAFDELALPLVQIVEPRPQVGRRNSPSDADPPVSRRPPCP